MSAYYESSAQWPPSGQAGWDHQTPPPARSGASSVIPREEPAAFTHQLEEVERAIDNLVKSGKMFGGSGGRRESQPVPGPARMHPAADGRQSAGPGSRPPSVPADFGDARGPHPGSNLQTFYASQRQQTSRGSNEAEQMMQAKRRMAAQRERELRNYHQEQQYNRTSHTDMSYGGTKPDRTLSPGGGLPADDDRRKLIAQQRSALYGGEASYAEGGYVDETGAHRGGGGPPAAVLRGHSPLAYEYGRPPPLHADIAPHHQQHQHQQQPLMMAEGGGQGSQSAGPNERSRANSNSSPQSNPPSGSKGGGMFDAPGASGGAGGALQSSRTSASSPGGSPPRQGSKSGGGQGPVAPIGTRPSVSGPASKQRATTPLPSPLSQGYNAGAGDEAGAAVQANPAGASVGGGAESLSSGGWGARANNGWGSKAGLGGVQASVWG